ncbi:MAG: DUF2284 domain-containing protein [archaeon]
MGEQSTKNVLLKTPKNSLSVDCHFKIIGKGELSVKKELFAEMCKKCRNYKNKYSCPPFSPDFEAYVKAEKLLVLLMKARLGQFSAYKPHFRLRIANAILKPRIEKIMRAMEAHTGTKFLGTGACRLCKPCKKKKGLACSHPDKMRYSLEALGVDCDKLAKNLFGISMQWYKDKAPPEYTLVICALPLRDEDARDGSRIRGLLAEHLDRLK